MPSLRVVRSAWVPWEALVDGPESAMRQHLLRWPQRAGCHTRGAALSFWLP